MEFDLGRCGDEGKVKEEKRSESINGGHEYDDAHRNQQIHLEGDHHDEELEHAKAEMGEAREENQRLKNNLERVMKDYQTLQMKFQDIVVENEAKHAHHHHHDDQEIIKTEEKEECDDDHQLVSLSLGRSLVSNNKYDQKSKVESKNQLGLGLDCKLGTSSKSGSILSMDDDEGVTKSNDDNENKRVRDEVCDQQNNVNIINPAKKARVCVRARCDTPTMNDGCQWRKYGQKTAKGNPCPRAYYRCTVAPSCPVRKQVQRCAEDMSILMTTYEGTHNHSLPLSATPMASTTSAAASMLLSGSSASSSGRPGDPWTATTLSSLHNSHPTITLDLTNNNTLSKSRSSFLFPSNNPPTSFNFTTSPNNSNINNNYNNFHRNNVFTSSLLNVTPGHRPSTSTSTSTVTENNMHHIINMPNPSTFSSHGGGVAAAAAESSYIAAATKAIAADPKFQSALAVALASIMNNNNGDGSSTQGLNWADLFPASS